MIKQLMGRSGVMLAYVTKKAGMPPKNPNGMQLPQSCDCIIDISKSFFLEMMEREKSYTRMYVYSFDSLASNLREYKVLRMSEFFGFSDTLLKP
jgi:hypothetical protein